MPAAATKTAKKPRTETHRVLAENLERFVQMAIDRGEAKDTTDWSRKKRLPVKTIQRIIGNQSSPTLDTIDPIARALKLHAWQLLIPGLDPSNPPVFVMSEAESALYQRIKADFRRLK